MLKVLNKFAMTFVPGFCMFDKKLWSLMHIGLVSSQKNCFIAVWGYTQNGAIHSHSQSLLLATFELYCSVNSIIIIFS